MQTGFSIIHANHLETLASLLIDYSRSQPLAPLETESVLVQSNGMADWLKLKQAQHIGISTSMDFPMPASFLWQMYQRVLQPELMNAPSPFAKDSLQWRLYRLLPELLEQPEFALPKRFLSEDASQSRQFQLARKLADLFDQYQLYRADWISGWEAGRLADLGPNEAWQASLWRALLESLPQKERQRSRAHLHSAFIERLQQDTPAGLPRRLFLFGINSMPQQLLEALYAMSHHCQLLLMILSPCQEYWGDKGEPLIEPFSASNPLLDSWGAQGRDFLQLLEDYQASESDWLQRQDITPYAEAASQTRADSIVCSLQQAILDNRPPATGQPLPTNPGLHFYPAYSRQREVEFLHDRLLHCFAADATLDYQDVVVMMPDVDAYVPHIEAVFNRYDVHDPRRLTYAISDRQHHAGPLYQALEYLLTLPEARLTLSEVMSLLQVDAIRCAAAIDEEDLPQLQQWASGAHIHWGLDGDHKRQLLSLPAEDNTPWRHLNSWQLGIDQLLAGYCAGDADIFPRCPSLDEVSANQGELLGRLAAFIERLRRLRQRLGGKQAIAHWADSFNRLLNELIEARDDDERLLLAQCQDAISAWQADCELADFDAPLALSQARQGWLDKLNQGGLSQQLSFNGITFCTLMPMRALPFRQVFLLGMNDGDYPHDSQPVDFDLMADRYRPGDRDRRDDDRYLFLEALMSVRDSLHISWVGRDISKGTELPPCTLVGQLRDLVDQYWDSGSDASACDALTTKPPLAAFSRRYFLPATSEETLPRTYANEWLQLHQPPQQLKEDTDAPLPPDELTAWQLAGLLREPDQVFFRERLKLSSIQMDEELEDDEPFAFDGLASWQLRQQLLQSLQQETPQSINRWQQTGALPVAGFGSAIFEQESLSAESIQRRLQERLHDAREADAIDIALPLTVLGQPLTLSSRLTNLWRDANGLLAVTQTVSNLKKKKNWRFDKLAHGWVNHLIASASGHAISSFFVSRDQRKELAPLPPQAAQQQLERLLLIYQQAWQQPLPFSYDELELNQQADDELAKLSQARLHDQLQHHWQPQEDSSRVFAELLYRPLQQALQAATKTPAEGETA